ncbi:MAG: hypothetical protein WAN68_22575, partial [Pseudolabrys sp.]
MFQREIHFSASHATLDPDRACSAAQDGTLLLSKTAIRLTRMIVPWIGGNFCLKAGMELKFH